MAIITLNNNSLSSVTSLPAGVGGKVLQVVATANQTLSQTSTNSTSFADVSGVDLVITPTSSSSNFIINVSYCIDTGGNDHGMITRLTYNHSGISQTQVDTAYTDFGFHINGTRANTWQSKNYHLAPSTTNEITFRLQFATVSSGETSYLNRKTIRLVGTEYSSWF